MGLKECDARGKFDFPKDSKFVCEEGVIIGTQTNDGSFDYRPEDQNLLRPDIKDIPIAE